MEFHQLMRVRKLYKTIMKLHKGLPEHIKVIGDTCTRDEFKKHKNCKAAEEEIFVQEWTKYALLLSQQLGLKGPKSSKKLGRHLSREQLDNMSDDQIQKLYEIMLETQGESEENEEISLKELK